MTSSVVRRAGLIFLAAVMGCGAASTAQASYFVRPVLQYGGSLVDGLKLDSDTSNSLTYYDSGTALEAHVDLADGTIKTYVNRTAPSSDFTGATGVMGEQIRYTGDSNTAVDLRFDFSADISAYFDEVNAPEGSDGRFIAIDAYFAVYEAGSGANWEQWTIVSPYADQALYNERTFETFESYGNDFSIYFENSLGTELFLESGKSYDIFAAFNLLVVPGSWDGWVTMDSLNTSTIGITAPGGTITSQSGNFLGFAKTPAVAPAVPEPATWAMMILGFGLVGAAARRRTVAIAA